MINNMHIKNQSGSSRLWILGIILVGAAAVGVYYTRLNHQIISNGTWKSETVENAGNGLYGTRSFTLQDNRWEIDFTGYGDKEQKYPLFRFHGEGPYTIGQASAKVSGAYDATFAFDKKEVTLLAQDPKVAQQLGFASCGLTVGQPKDVSDSGCSFVPSITACGQEYDIVRQEGDTLYLGARPADNNLCTIDQRPATVGYPLVK